MRKIIYSAMVSVDGFVEKDDGDFTWARPDEELHRFANERARESSAFLMGRSLYEMMVPFWPDVAKNPAGCDYVDEFAQIFDAIPRYVVSNSLDEVDPGSTLLTGDLAEAVGRLKEDSRGFIDMGGPGLADSLEKLRLVDGYCLMVIPIVIGNGKPFFGPNVSTSELRLTESRNFESGAVALTYERA